MAFKVVMPQLGESVVEGTVVKWLVREGDRVEKDQPLLEVSTDKVDTEIPSPEAGTITKILVSEGTTVPVGAELALIETVSEERPAAEAKASREGPKQETTASAPTSPPASLEAAAQKRKAASPPRVPRKGHRRISPLVARIASEYNVDLDAIEGTGIEGRITKKDILAYLERSDIRTEEQSRPPSAAMPAGLEARGAEPATPGAAYSPPRYTPKPEDEVRAFSPLRRRIAGHMVYSKRTAPHVGTVTEVDMLGVSRLRAKHKERYRQEGVVLTFVPFAVGATVRALRDFPAMNASVQDDAMILKHEINIGIAVETERGLVVPVIKNADEKSVAGLAREIQDLAERAREKRISVDDLSGGTFTISNPGREGNLYGFAIINQPQVGILRMGQIVKRPVVREIDGEDAIVVRPMMYLALSYDHRAVDGVTGNGFLCRVQTYLEEADFQL